MQVHLNRVDHDQYRQLSPDVSILQACRCGCGAVRDTRGATNPQPFGVWAMTHTSPNGPTYTCAVCGTLALPTNSNLIDGRRFVHRSCDPRTTT